MRQEAPRLQLRDFERPKFFESSPAYEQRVMTGLRSSLLALAQSKGASVLPSRVDRTLAFMNAQVGKPEFMQFYRDIRDRLEADTLSEVEKRPSEATTMPRGAARVDLGVQPAPPGSARGMARDILVDTFGHPHKLVDLWGDLPPSRSLGKGRPAMGESAYNLANTFSQQISMESFSAQTYLNELEKTAQMQQVEDQVTASIEAAGFTAEGAPAPPAKVLRELVLKAFIDTCKDEGLTPASESVEPDSPGELERGASRWDAGVDAFLEQSFLDTPVNISPLAKTGYMEMANLSNVSFTSNRAPHDFLAERRPLAERVDMMKPGVKSQFERFMRQEVAVQSAKISPLPTSGSLEMRRMLMNARSAALSRMQFPDPPVAPGEVSPKEVLLRLSLLDKCHADLQAIRGLPGGNAEALMLKKSLDRIRDDLHGFGFPSQYSAYKLQLERVQSDLLLSPKSTDPYYSPKAFGRSFDSLSNIALKKGRPALTTEADVRQVRQFVHGADSYLALQVKTTGQATGVRGPLTAEQHSAARDQKQKLSAAFLERVVAVCEDNGFDVHDFNRLSPAEKRVVYSEAMGRWGGLPKTDVKSGSR